MKPDHIFFQIHTSFILNTTTLVTLVDTFAFFFFVSCFSFTTSSSSGENTGAVVTDLLTWRSAFQTSHVQSRMFLGQTQPDVVHITMPKPQWMSQSGTVKKNL